MPMRKAQRPESWKWSLGDLTSDFVRLENQGSRSETIPERSVAESQCPAVEGLIRAKEKAVSREKSSPFAGLLSAQQPGVSGHDPKPPIQSIVRSTSCNLYYAIE